MQRPEKSVRVYSLTRDASRLRQSQLLKSLGQEVAVKTQ